MNKFRRNRPSLLERATGQSPAGCVGRSREGVFEKVPEIRYDALVSGV
jgi:hypothetical protein